MDVGYLLLNMIIKRGARICLALSIVFVLLFTTGCGKGGTTEAKSAYKNVKLVYWRVFDDEDTMRPLIEAYRKIHPNVTIEYRKLRLEEYERELLDALSEDRGPDIFSVPNTWMIRYKAKLLPLPKKTTLPVKHMVGTIKKEEVVELIPTTSITPTQVSKTFLDVVASDAIMKFNTGTKEKPVYEDRIFGLPLSMDNLVMYYNKDILNNAGVINPPKTWTDFQSAVKQITKIDETGNNILLSGAAIGTANNVVRNFDILSLLMMQNLAPMLDADGYAAFDKKPAKLKDVEGLPGLGALEYYTQFASPLYEGYCWNDTMPNSLDAFIKGNVGFFFGYAYQRSTIEAKAPKLNFDVASVPQVGADQKVNYANYWLEVVSDKTKLKDYAWDFVQFITNEKNITDFLMKNKKPTALKSATIINKQLADSALMVFADQLLTSKSWYHGYNELAAEQAFTEMINATLTGTVEPRKALQQAVEKINQSIKKK